MNTYVVICPATGASVIVDPGADPETILALAAGTRVDKILLTHAHHDHVGALEEIKATTGAPVYLHPAEHAKFGIAYDVPLADGDSIAVGDELLHAIHTPGHTPGMISLRLDPRRYLVGDTLFVGGPGRTWAPEEFAVTMHTLQHIVFAWADDAEFFPGHGPSGVIGTERPAFTRFVARGWPADLHGDVAWA
jgi:glyoxylase-like metal-dependent hydrolase (beta-lactamase superfamily II)